MNEQRKKEEEVTTGCVYIQADVGRFIQDMYAY